MVDPVSNADRARTLRRAKVAVVLLVAGSAALIGVHGGASLEVIVVAGAAGLVVGSALVWYLFPDADDIAPASSRQYRK